MLEQSSVRHLASLRNRGNAQVVDPELLSHHGHEIQPQLHLPLVEVEHQHLGEAVAVLDVVDDAVHRVAWVLPVARLADTGAVDQLSEAAADDLLRLIGGGLSAGAEAEGDGEAQGSRETRGAAQSGDGRTNDPMQYDSHLSL